MLEGKKAVVVISRKIGYLSTNRGHFGEDVRDRNLLNDDANLLLKPQATGIHEFALTSS